MAVAESLDQAEAAIENYCESRTAPSIFREVYKMKTAQIADYGSRGAYSYVLFVFFIYIVGLHLRLTVYSGGKILIPLYLMLASFLLLAPKYFWPMLNKAGYGFLGLVVFTCAQPFLTFAPGSALGTLHSTLHMVASVATTTMMIYALSTVPKAKVRRLALVVWGVMLALAVLESTGLKPVFDQVRDVLYAGTGRFVYSSDMRDIEIYGKVRSTVFATEPSFLADTLCVLILTVVVLDEKSGKKWLLIKAASMLLASFILAPSLKMIFYMVSASLWVYWPTTKKGLERSIVLLIFAAVFGTIGYMLFFAFLEGAIGKHMNSGSFYGRIAVAPIVGFRAISDYPIFGYGIGNTDGLSEIIFEAWQSSGAFDLFPWFQNFPANNLMTNGFWWQWSFLGVFGGLLFVLLVRKWLVALGEEYPARTIVCVWIVWYSGFAFIDPVSWSIFMFFTIGGLKRADDAQDASVGGQRSSNSPI